MQIPQSVTAAYLKYAKGYYVKNDVPTDEIAAVKVSIRHRNRNYAQTFATFSVVSCESDEIKKDAAHPLV